MIQIGEVFFHKRLGNVRITEIFYRSDVDELWTTFRPLAKPDQYAFCASVEAVEQKCIMISSDLLGVSNAPSEQHSSTSPAVREGR